MVTELGRRLYLNVRMDDIIVGFRNTRVVDT